MATDCSGMCVPEIAIHMLSKHSKPSASVHNVFACDVLKASQKWMAHLGLSTVLGDMNNRIWKVESGEMVSKAIDGKLFKGTAENAALDLYVSGFMCTPFTPNGQRQAWQDEHSKTFWSTVKTIGVLRPRVFVLENVLAISNNANRAVVESALSKLSGYMIVRLKVNGTQFGVPHHRPRVYVVGIRKDAAKEMYTNFQESTLESWFMNRLLSMAGKQCGDFDHSVWLRELGHPIEKVVAKENAPDAECTCSITTTCEAHPCRCELCKKHGAGKMKCRWRSSHKTYVKGAGVRAKRRQYLKSWRQVKKDIKLKSPPSYLEMARSRKIGTDAIKSPSRRVILQAMSMQANILSAKSVLNLNKSIGRVQLRTDGLVPTLGHGCGGLFFPAAAAYVTVPQLLCLTGLDPKVHAKDFSFATTVGNDIEILVGNAMCLPVIGSIMAVALHMLRP